MVPLKYTVVLSIDPNKDTFDGTVFIEVNILKPASTIWLNGKDLDPEFVQLSQGAVLRDARARVVNKELIEVDVSGSPVSGVWGIYISYQGRLDDKAVVGAYRRKVEGEWYVYTTFTPIEARRAIPCFDEPRFKTPWEISIKIPRGQQAFSNAARDRRNHGSDGQKMVHFGVTEPLPSELVAFAVGPFDVYRGQPAGHGTPMRAITPKGQAAEGKAAAETTVAVLPRLEEYTGIPYRVRQTGSPGAGRRRLRRGGESGTDRVPGSRDADGAGIGDHLENPRAAFAGSARDGASMVRRSGDASELGGRMVERRLRHVDLGKGDGSGGQAGARASVLDRGAGTHHANRRFSPHASGSRGAARSRRHARHLQPFVYDKGAAVLLMLEGWLGEDKFRDGLRAYLRDHRFGNASTRDLADELKRATGTDPAPVLRSLLDGTGIPQVRGQIQCDRSNRLILRQTGAAAIPVCYRGDGISQTCEVLDAPSREVALSSCPSWIYLNSGGTGYYRVAWDAKPLAALPIEKLTPAERLTLAYDLRARKTASARLVLAKLQSDEQPEIAEAARDALK